ncbi:hypothetical protein QTN25_008610 [Entamoeba marina]
MKLTGIKDASKRGKKDFDKTTVNSINSVEIDTKEKIYSNPKSKKKSFDRFRVRSLGLDKLDFTNEKRFSIGFDANILNEKRKSITQKNKLSQSSPQTEISTPIVSTPTILTPIYPKKKKRKFSLFHKENNTEIIINNPIVDDYKNESVFQILQRLTVNTTLLEHTYDFNDLKNTFITFRQTKPFDINLSDKNVYLRNVNSLIEFLTLLPFNKLLIKYLLLYPNHSSIQDTFYSLVERFFEVNSIIVNQKETKSITLIRILCIWLSCYGDDFSNISLSIICKEFIDLIEKLSHTKEYQFIEPLLVEELQITYSNNLNQNGKIRIRNRNDELNKIITENDQSCSIEWNSIICSVNIDVIGKQLTICELQYMKMLIPKDYYFYLNDQTKKISMIDKYLKWSQRITHWIVYELINKKSLNERIDVWNKVISLAYDLFKRKNFNSLVAVINAFNHQTVSRMITTWKTFINKREYSSIYYDLLDAVEKMIISSKNVTTMMTPPAIPYFKLQIQRIIQINSRETCLLPIEFCNDIETINPPPMLDLFKYTKIGAIIDVIETFANSPYRYGENKELLNFLTQKIWELPSSDIDLLSISLTSENL